MRKGTTAHNERVQGIAVVEAGLSNYKGDKKPQGKKESRQVGSFYKKAAPPLRPLR
jgi:hypothetical protein